MLIQAVGIHRSVARVGARVAQARPAEGFRVRFGGVFEELEVESERRKLLIDHKKLDSALDPERVLITIQGRPMSGLDLLEIIQKTSDKDVKKFLKGTRKVAGAAGLLFSPLALAGLPMIPLGVGGGIYFLAWGATKIFACSDTSLIKALEPSHTPEWEVKLKAAMAMLKDAGLISEPFTEGYRLTRLGQQVLKTGEVKLRKPESSTSAIGETASAGKKKIRIQPERFSYEGLSKADRLALFKTMLAKNATGKISGFQVLEKLGALIQNQSWVVGLLKKGFSEDALRRQFLSSGDVKTDAVWLQHKLKTFESMGLVQQVNAEKGLWTLTPQGKTVVSLGDPVYSGVIQPADLHEIFQQGIDFLEAEKIRQFQQLEKSKEDYREVVASISVLETRIQALQAGKTTSGPEGVPVWMQLERANKELALKQKWVDRFKLAIEGRELVYRKFKDSIDVTVSNLMEGQLKVRILGLDHSTEEIMGHLELKDGAGFDSAGAYLTRWYVQQMRENPQAVGGVEMQDLLAHVDVGLMGQAPAIDQETVDLMVKADEVMAGLRAEGTVQEKKSGQ